MLLRLARLARLLRLLKLVKSLQGIDPLFLMMTTLKGSMSVLFWAFILLTVCQTMFAFLLNQILVTYYLEEDNDHAIKLEVFKHFGTFTRSFFSMFEITLGNWVPVGRLLVDDVSEWFMIFSVGHKLTMGFAVIGVINGIFIQETFKVAACDDTLMLLQKQRQLKVHTKKMEAFFKEADESGDGKVDLEEFRAILDTAQVRVWLAAQELDASDADKLFMLLDKGNGSLTATDLVKGVARLKGGARSIDLIVSLRQMAHLLEEMHRLHDSIGEMQIAGRKVSEHHSEQTPLECPDSFESSA